MDAVTISGVVIAVVTAGFAGWQAYEARKQRLLAEKDKPPPAVPTAPAEKDKPPPALPSKPNAAGKTVLSCGVYDYPPLSHFPPGRAAAASGILVELGTEVLTRLDVEARFVRFDYKGFYGSDDVIPDLIIGMFDTKRRRQRMNFSRAFYEIGLQGVCRKEQDSDILCDLRDGDLRVAVYDGEIGWEFLNDEIPDAEEQRRAVVVAGGRQRDTMNLLTSGGYDVVLMDEVCCINFLSEDDHKDNFKLAFPHPPQTFDTCIAMKPVHADLLAGIDREIERVRNEKWFLDKEAAVLAGLETVIARRGLRQTRRT